jgi:hypothetical protein
LTLRLLAAAERPRGAGVLRRSGGMADHDDLRKGDSKTRANPGDGGWIRIAGDFG